MSTFAINERLTLVEVLKRMGPDGDLLTMAEVLDEENAVLEDAVWVKANAKFTHVSMQRNVLPAGQARDFNAGVLPSATQGERQEDVIMMLEDYSEVDKKLAMASGDADGYRNQEARGILEGMGQTIAGKIFYGNHLLVSEEMTGFAPRLATIDSYSVWDTGGTGSDLSSIFLVQWGEDACHLIYPEGSTAGLMRENLGQETKVLSDGSMYEVLREHFSIDVGLVIRNPKCASRVANIETSGSADTFDEDLVIKALFKMKGGGRRAVLYVNDTIYAQMVIRAKDKANVNLFWSNAFGEDTLTFMGRPIRLVDQLVETETALTT
ncbi:MAG: hypothetical protein KAR06_01225 [Deltaproteobacteria bacterium]|nr:hypothetical protein [Deltaproteobacteria bacterium]